MYNYLISMIHKGLLGLKPPFQVGVGLGEYLWIEFKP